MLRLCDVGQVERKRTCVRVDGVNVEEAIGCDIDDSRLMGCRFLSPKTQRA